MLKINATPHELMELATKWTKIAYGETMSITPEDLKILGIRLQKTYKAMDGRSLALTNFRNISVFVYERITNQPHPGSKAKDEKVIHQEYGLPVAMAIKNLMY